MAQYAIVTDLNRCVGCMGCMVACKTVHEVPIGNFWSKVLRVGPSKKAEYATSNDVEMYYLPMTCQHCADPACVSVCPVGASMKMEDGTVQVDETTCIGCGLCVSACPYGVRYVNADINVAQKCTLCTEIVEEGGLPQCVMQCGGRARFFGDLEKGIETFEAPDIAYSADRDPSVTGYDPIYTGNRITLGELAQEYTADEVHQLADTGTGPNFYYILRDRVWHEGVVYEDAYTVDNG